ncbi:MAG: xanthine dehydrogenase family protein subunit M [Caldilineaceae bacterium]|nr:xanthine dehydrogenase family protein subunit M [Caldilineaceae bacterium]
MRQFDYSSATTLDETIQLLGQSSHDAPGSHAAGQPGGQNGATRVLAGGTDLLTLMKADIAAPSHLVDIKRLDELPRGIEENEQGTMLGALTTLAEIELSEAIQTRYPVLAQAAALAATPQLRNMATIGGNLLQRPRCWYFRHANFHCWLKGGDECLARDGENQFHALFDTSPCVAVHPSDLASALLALNANVQLRGPTGERTVALDEFFRPPDENRRQETTITPDELLLSIHIPSLPPGTRSTYLKAMDRKVWAFALVGVAARLQMQNDTIADARLVLSGVAPIPWRLTNAEQMLVGQRADEAMFAQVAEAALSQAQPLAHNGYKIPIAQSLIRRALAALVQG